MKTEICVTRAFIDQCIALHEEQQLDAQMACMAKIWYYDNFPLFALAHSAAHSSICHFVFFVAFLGLRSWKIRLQPNVYSYTEEPDTFTTHLSFALTLTLEFRPFTAGASKP